VLEARVTVLEQLSAQTLQATFRTLFPMPCRQRYTAVVLLPEERTVKTRVVNAITACCHATAEAWEDTEQSTRTAATLLAAAAVLALVAVRLRWT